MRYYQLQRQSDARTSSRTTVRMLESLMRLAEAHAKLMFREQVLLEVRVRESVLLVDEVVVLSFLSICFFIYISINACIFNLPLQDAIVAISCVELSNTSAVSLGEDSPVYAPFPEDAEAAYETLERDVFKIIHYSR